MCNSSPFLITFTPIQRFFFGSSFSFNEGFNVHSLLFPQPTTIAGCIRNTILIQNDCCKYTDKGRIIPDLNHKNTKELTGTSTIKNIYDNDINFGIVNKFSPVFLVKHSDNGSIEDTLFPLPQDIVLNNDTLDIVNNIENNKGETYINNYKIERVDKSPKSPKRYLSQRYGSSSFWTLYCKNLSSKDVYPIESDIFESSSQTGISLSNMRVEKGKFYIKHDYSLSKEYSFGVIVWLSESDKLKDGIVVLGGEQSTFKMKVYSLQNGSDTKNTLNNNTICESLLNDKTSFSNQALAKATKIVLLSPLYYSDSLFENLKFARTPKIKSFRWIDKTTNTKKNNIKTKIPKTNIVNVLPTGSILYFKENLKTSMIEYKMAEKLGYNQVLNL